MSVKRMSLKPAMYSIVGRDAEAVRETLSCEAVIWVLRVDLNGSVIVILMLERAFQIGL